MYGLISKYFKNIYRFLDNTNYSCLEHIYSIDPITGNHKQLDREYFRLSKKILGKGNQGTVYQGLFINSINLVTKVAIKRILLNREGDKEIKNNWIYNEAKILSQLNYPGI